MNMKTEFLCTNCGLMKVPENDTTTGYGVDSDGFKICYECCGTIDRKKLSNAKLGDKFTYYLSVNATFNEYGPNTGSAVAKVTNWPGTLTIFIYSIRQGRHNFAGKRYDVWFNLNGKNFHGVTYGDNTQICHITCVK